MRLSHAICMGLSVGAWGLLNAGPNLWPYDGSFETSSDLFKMPRDGTVSYEGKYSLRIDPGVRGGSSKAFLLKKANRPGFVSFFVKADRPCRITVRSLDDWYSWNGQKEFQVGKEWTQCVLPQKVQSQASSVSFAITPEDKAATLWLDAVSYAMEAPPAAYEAGRPFDAGSSVPESNGVLNLSDKPVVHTVAARNNTDKEAGFTLTAALENGSTREKNPLLSRAITLKPGELFETEVTVLPHRERGYYVIRTELVKEDKVVASHAQPFSVVDPPPPVRDDSFFAIHFSDGSYGRNVGASWSRTFEHWSGYSPDANGEYHIKSEPLIALNTKHGMRQLRCINLVNSPAPLRSEGSFSTNETVAKWVTAMVKAYQGKLKYIELENEPDLTFSNQPEKYAELLNYLIPKVRELAPGVKIAGSSVSGVDFNQNFLFTEKVLAIAGKNLDVLAVHPYTWNHYVDASGADIGPEGAKTYERALLLQKLIAKHGGKAEVWFGEVGWAPDVTEDYLSPASRRNASYIPRLFVLSKAAGVKKVFYFLINETCVERERYDYGIWRANKPLPAVSAYAAAAQAIEFAKPLKTIANQDYHAFTFQREDGKLLAALWLSNGERAKIHLNLPEDAEVRDMFWNPAAVKDNSWMLSGEMSYVLCGGITPEAFNEMISQARVELPPLKASWELDGGKALVVTLNNLRTTPQKGSLTLSGVHFRKSERKVDLASGGSQAFKFTSESFLSGKTVKLTAKTDCGDFSSEFRPVILECPSWTAREFKSEALPLKGRLPDLDSRNYLLPNDPTNGWDGPGNLSVKSAIGHDRDNLYLRIDVRDDIHRQEGKPGRLWARDSIQLAIDSRGNARPGDGYDTDDYEFGFALSSGTPKKELTYTCDTSRFNQILDGAGADVKREGDVTRYRIAIPWRVLKVNPESGTVFGLNFTANDSDGGNLRFWMGPTPGIVDSKNPGVYQKFLIP